MKMSINNNSDNLVSNEDINRQFEELLNELNLTEEKKGTAVCLAVFACSLLNLAEHLR